MKTKNRSDFDYRIVKYENIHEIKEEQYNQLIKSLDPQPNEVILDGMAGYGSITSYLLDKVRESNLNIKIFILDNSFVQVKKIKENLEEIDSSHIIEKDIRDTGFEDNKFDKVVIKMGIHEVSKKEQEKIFNEIYRVLKPGGKFIIWEVSLNQKNQKFFQNIIKKKDDLANFNELVKNRYLPRYDELVNLFKKSGFKEIKKDYEAPFLFSTLKRRGEMALKEKPNLSEEEKDKRVNKLTEYIRDNISDSLKKELNFQDLGGDIQIEVKQVIMSGIK